LAAFGENRFVRNLLGESVLEDILGFRSRRLLVDEFAELEIGKQRRENRVGFARRVAYQPERKFLADYCQRLQQFLLGGCEAVDPRRDYSFDRGRNPYGRERLRKLD